MLLYILIVFGVRFQVLEMSAETYRLLSTKMEQEGTWPKSTTLSLSRNYDPGTQDNLFDSVIAITIAIAIVVQMEVCTY